MKKIIVIQPKFPGHKKLRVAAYCRVSTLSLVQRRSLDWQIKTYTNMISENPDWIFVGVFYDVGKSGLRRKGRTGLDKVMKKAAKVMKLTMKNFLSILVATTLVLVIFVDFAATPRVGYEIKTKKYLARV